MPCYVSQGEKDSYNRSIRERIAKELLFPDIDDAERDKRDIIYMYLEATEWKKFPDKPTEDLCKVCKTLTKEQMNLIYPENGVYPLLYWYKKHLSDDYENNDNKEEKEIALKELERIK